MTRVDELILQLQNLQVQQKELTARLAKEREKEKKADKAEPGFRIGQEVIVTTASLTTRQTHSGRLPRNHNNNHREENPDSTRRREAYPKSANQRSR